jgi:hypothetical protein
LVTIVVERYTLLATIGALLILILLCDFVQSKFNTTLTIVPRRLYSRGDNSTYQVKDIKTQVKKSTIFGLFLTIVISCALAESTALPNSVGLSALQCVRGGRGGRGLNNWSGCQGAHSTVMCVCVQW